LILGAYTSKGLGREGKEEEGKGNGEGGERVKEGGKDGRERRAPRFG